ncbi:hypothetical protein AB3G45_19600 [Shinella sp. S4-D37]|uniref:hypothetical protein n=1 Tax=Shinella sp. S4-D37 TaxID=3161999 RepID=UPI0034667281
MDINELEFGDLVLDGQTLVYEDTADYTIYLIREGDYIRIRRDFKNVRAVLEANARAAAEFNSTGQLGEFVKVASVPVGMHYQWDQEGILDDPVALARRLNDADFSKVRTNNLRV